MENLNGEEIKPKKKKYKIIRGLIVVAFLVGSYLGVFYLGNMLATKGIVIGSVPEKAVADLEAIEDSGKYSNLFTLRSMLFSMYDGELDD